VLGLSDPQDQAFHTAVCLTHRGRTNLPELSLRPNSQCSTNELAT